MARTITVDPAKLESVATSIESQATDYKKITDQLFTEVEGMSAAWQGADNIAFTTQISGFRDDFEAMTKLMRQFSEFLNISAKAYRETQSEVVTQAKRLKN
jgi:WXG100 family type VII secretion target